MYTFKSLITIEMSIYNVLVYLAIKDEITFNYLYHWFDTCCRLT